MTERPWDCAGHHMRFPERSIDSVTWELMHPPTERPRLPVPIPAMHQHEDALCSQRFGVAGCPGIPHCRDWIIGHYDVAVSLANIRSDGLLAFELSLQRDWYQRMLDERKPLVAEADGGKI